MKAEECELDSEIMSVAEFWKLPDPHYFGSLFEWDSEESEGLWSQIIAEYWLASDYTILKRAGEYATIRDSVSGSLENGKFGGNHNV